MATELKDIMISLEALSPEGREEGATFIRTLHERERQRTLDLEERRRSLRAAWGSFSREEAMELLRIGREAFDTLDDEESCQSQ
jgi:hypothetical protein